MPNRAARRRAASQHKPIRSKDRRQIVLMAAMLLGAAVVAAGLFLLGSALA
jgi:hypothetical protein